MDKLYRHRRFGLAATITATACVALFQGHIGGGEFIAVSAAVLGLYGGIADKDSDNG